MVELKVSSALATEAGTIRVACSMAAKREAKDIIIETDCQPVVKMLNSGLSSDWEIRVQLEDAKAFVDNFNVSFGRPPPPLPDLYLSEEAANQILVFIHSHVNALLSTSKDIALG
ncbi:hypothetical protein RHSIM_Rhsim04G0031400 [Rhododendron simsii]|uniref:Uncharacterized protein n=1 Tax=Rhododendron simsii TaxID=118357 RepID=A0A834LRE4_RHOSS|nr:hypothetical protein RHSIM_Rhsim04G0031400 [Rhododendron simsii]